MDPVLTSGDIKYEGAGSVDGGDGSGGRRRIRLLRRRIRPRAIQHYLVHGGLTATLGNMGLFSAKAGFFLAKSRLLLLPWFPGIPGIHGNTGNTWNTGIPIQCGNQIELCSFCQNGKKQYSRYSRYSRYSVYSIQQRPVGPCLA